MKKAIVFLIKVYQTMPLHSHSQCRHYPTCSNYMLEAVEIHGSLKGVYLGIKRILKCHPLGTSGYDPVPKKEKK